MNRTPELLPSEFPICGTLRPPARHRPPTLDPGFEILTLKTNVNNYELFSLSSGFPSFLGVFLTGSNTFYFRDRHSKFFEVPPGTWLLHRYQTGWFSHVCSGVFLALLAFLPVKVPNIFLGCLLNFIPLSCCQSFSFIHSADHPASSHLLGWRTFPPWLANSYWRPCEFLTGSQNRRAS